MPFASNDIIDSDDLSFLHEVLTEVCRERTIAPGSEEEKAVADQLINWFLFGIREKQELKSMLNPMIDPAGLPATGT
ncbi:hypothetical protein J2T09_002431 [Neorhizobium huautlense]|uniref:Uncharacterized protein n=1 Tax=Neorhizobium huautlense TaxID=67774 RepID=A0ABT9PT87_9HYPH|nr:hypothetical protein [Neorhizobium huautlense]MDP9837674.1 hypothetical protein [Neorhizobium huautlense]